ncbi:MAG: hypothetical protein A3K77_07140 [Euryarchaeota archaeon RBG_13_31_8]|nr:MAG: hypothetical protein A3K77_07140 [Euryarchaeota archaeon RBG_13_31_8]
MLPFLIVEFYFQDYFTIGIIAIFASIILTLCVFIEYFKEKSIRMLDVEKEDIQDLNMSLKNTQYAKAAFYYFRN